MKTKLSNVLIIALILALVSLACGAGTKATQALPTNPPVPTNPPPPTVPPTTSTPTIALDPEKRIEEGGYSFKPAPGYTMDVSLGSMVNMLAPGADSDLGPAFMLVGGLTTVGTTNESLIESIKTADIILGTPIKVMVSGMEGLVADITRPAGDLKGRIVVVMVSSTHQFMMLGAAPSARWEQEISLLFDAVLTSVKFFEPKVPTVEPTIEPTVEPKPQLVEIRQWAVSATASSEYGSTGWSAGMATGAPDTAACGDFDTAWASSSSTTAEWLELTYAAPVKPTQINLLLTYNPNQVVKVELLDTASNYHEVYTGKPVKTDCPYTLTIDVSGADFETAGVRISIDQSVLQGWGEIDAVELVGMGDPSKVPATPVPAPTATPFTFETPAGFLWRIGGMSGIESNQFGALGGMDAGPDNQVYVADNIRGVLIFDQDGKLMKEIKPKEMNNASDVKVGADGKIYVAAWGNNQVWVLSPTGDVLARFGTEGNGDGQFGGFSPNDLAVSADNKIYVLDRNTDNNKKDFDRVQVFDNTGKFLNAIPITDEWLSPTAIDLGPDGNIYVLGFMGGYILKLSPDGKELGQLGKDALGSAGGPQGLSIDQAGNFYVAAWHNGVIKLDPQGNLIAEWGVYIENGEVEWPEGGFNSPSGVAVLPDGSRVFFDDWSGNYAYITAFQFVK